MDVKVALITGCSKGGIGYELCQTFHQRGFKVYATARNLDKLDGLPADVGKVSMDVDNEADIAKGIKVPNFPIPNADLQRVLDEAGHIDILVNCNCFQKDSNGGRSIMREEAWLHPL